MTTKTEKKFPRNDVLDRQSERTRKVLELDEKNLENVTGGSAERGNASIYGLPPPPDLR
ncbi:hypothetical protein [Cystobacter ferrugineus]|uniref:hypothetical protein n=1 Tax=Cystobacter ferrugineus TaxID=83449 RepID=UPI000A9AD5CF|nr:hypothetical protein [Cystobacter ferrugineus]